VPDLRFIGLYMEGHFENIYGVAEIFLTVVKTYFKTLTGKKNSTCIEK
jgi:hypothetical protein